MKHHAVLEKRAHVKKPVLNPELLSWEHSISVVVRMVTFVVKPPPPPLPRAREVLARRVVIRERLKMVLAVKIVLRPLPSIANRIVADPVGKRGRW